MMARGERPVPTNSSFPESLNKSSLHNVNRTGRIPSTKECRKLLERMILPPSCLKDQGPKQKEMVEPARATAAALQRGRAIVYQSATPEWWSLTGSNRRHPACKAGALPAELRPRIPYGFIVSASSAQFQSKPFTSRNPSGEARKVAPRQAREPVGHVWPRPRSASIRKNALGT